jgi:hypothetical protein
MAGDHTRGGLLRATLEILRPIVRRLLAAGVPFGELEAQMRELFIDVADADLALPGRKQTDSRISLLTGINRKEVRRLRGRHPRAERPPSFGRNQAASLVSRWTADPRATDRSGRPVSIPYQATRGPSFVKLARQVTVDLPPRAILDELVRSGAVELLAGDRVALRADSYIPKGDAPKKLEMLAEDPPELVETMLRNIFLEDGDPLLQRKVFYDNLGSAGLDRVRRAMRQIGQRFLREANRKLSRFDRDRNPKAPGGERRYAGVGIYYFEAPEPRPMRDSRETRRGLASSGKESTE